MSFTFPPRFTSCLAAVVLSIAVADSDALPGSQANAASNAETNCAWDCKVVDSTFGLEMKVLISEFRLISLQLKHDQQVNEKCLNQTDLHNSSLAELWIWLTGDIPSHGGRNMSQQSFNKSNNWFRKSLEGQTEASVSCSVKPATDSNGTKPSLNDVIAMVLMEEVKKIGDLSLSETALCSKLSAKNGSYICLNLTTNIGHNMDSFSPANWLKKAYTVPFVIILVVAIWYFPFILCLFTPTEMKSAGRVMIVLDKTSPQGIGSCIANILGSYLVADVDSIKWWDTFLFPFLLSSSAVSICLLQIKVIDVRFPQPSVLKDTISSPLFFAVIVFSNTAIHASLGFWRSNLRKIVSDISCNICSDFENQKVFHDRENPRYYGRNEMKMHMRILPYMPRKCLSQTLQCFDCFSCISSRPVLKCWLVILLSPFLLMVFFLRVTVELFYYSPLLTFSIVIGERLKYFERYFQKDISLGCFLFFFAVEMLIVLCSCITLVFTIVIGSVATMRGILMDLPDILPFAILVLVFVFYLWKCYIPYPRKYSKLANTLYRCYIATRETGDNQQVQNAEDDKRLLPKDLYLKARKKLMPLQESIGELKMKVTVYLGITIIILISITDAPNSKLNDETKALGTFLASLIPKALEMLFDKDPEMKKADDENFVKKVASFVEEYYKKQNDNTNSNNGASAETEGSQTTNEAGNNNNDNGLSAGTATSSNENIPLLFRQHDHYGTRNPPENTIQGSSA